MDNKYSDNLKKPLESVVSKIMKNPGNKGNKKLFVKTAAAFVATCSFLTGCGDAKSVEQFRDNIQTIQEDYKDGVREDIEVKGANMFKDDIDKRIETMEKNGDNRNMNTINDYNLLKLYQGVVTGYIDLYDSENYTIVAGSDLNVSSLTGKDEFYITLSEAIVSQDLANEISDSLQKIELSGFDPSTNVEDIVDGYEKDTAKQEEKVDDLVEEYMTTFNVAPENMDTAKKEFRAAIAKWTIQGDGNLGDFLEEHVTIVKWPKKAVDFFNNAGKGAVEGINGNITAFNSWNTERKYGEKDEEKDDSSTTSGNNGNSGNSSNGNSKTNPAAAATNAIEKAGEGVGKGAQALGEAGGSLLHEAANKLKDSEEETDARDAISSMDEHSQNAQYWLEKYKEAEANGDTAAADQYFRNYEEELGNITGTLGEYYEGQDR